MDYFVKAVADEIRGSCKCGEELYGQFSKKILDRAHHRGSLVLRRLSAAEMVCRAVEKGDDTTDLLGAWRETL